MAAQQRGGQPARIVVGISGASGAIYGIRLLEALANLSDVETHLIVSRAGATTIKSETKYSMRDVEDMADVVHRPGNIGASIASGSFRTAGMVIAPCSIKTLSAVAHCYAADLIARTADVHLKEGRPVILMVRETPLHYGHIKLMETAILAGARIAPPVPAFYHRPETLEDIIAHSVNRVIDLLGFSGSATVEWQGLGEAAGDHPPPEPPSA